MGGLGHVAVFLLVVFADLERVAVTEVWGIPVGRVSSPEAAMPCFTPAVGC